MAPTLTTEEAIFQAALEIEAADERSAYLAAACGDQVGLRRRVEALLRRFAEAEGPLDRPAVSVVTTTEPPLAEQPGSVIGPYKLLEQIGEGGMGLVFMAEQSEPVRRKVALKIIKPGMDTRQVVARFEAERQALAMMDHPNIAKILDAGTTSVGQVANLPVGQWQVGNLPHTGRPYFVMELVRGVPVTDFCDQHRLDTRRRLELFVQVCRAVQHAHQKGVIHRDLKPGNVLVTLHDTVAVPKIIDFGIAKATGQRLTERTLFTHFAQMVGTPLYMSPEQAEMSGLDVDTRSDVYSLGVLLYELLTGTTPFESETLKQVGFDEMRRVIREEEPPRPSQRLSTLAAARQSTVSERRGVDGRRLGQLLRGELDWVVMRALEKDRNRRYESASTLAADVERYLADDPVEAGRPSAVYRLRKFVRRNRRGLIAVGTVLAVLVAATAVSAWQAVNARDALRQAEADRDQAKVAQSEAEEAKRRAATESAVATAIGNFLQQDLLQQADTYVQRDDLLIPERNLTVKEALDRAGEKIGERFCDQPLVEAAIRRTIGQVYRSVGEYQPAVSHLECAVALFKANVGPHHADTIRSMWSLGDASRYVFQHAHAITLYQEILESRKAVFGPDHPETLASVHQLAVAYEYAGQLDESVRLLEQLVDRCRTLFGPAHSRTLGNMQRLSWNYGLTGRLGESLTLMRRARELHRSVTSPEQWSPTWWHIMVCQWAEEFDEADRLLRELLEHHRRQQTSLTRQRELPNNLASLALNLLLQGRPDEAEPPAREAVAMNQTEGYQRFYSVSVLGAVLLGQRKYAEAEPFLLQGYEGLKQTEAVHPLVRRWSTQAGERVVRLYEETGQPEKARLWRENHRTPTLRE